MTSPVLLIAVLAEVRRSADKVTEPEVAEPEPFHPMLKAAAPAKASPVSVLAPTPVTAMLPLLEKMLTVPASTWMPAAARVTPVPAVPETVIAPPAVLRLFAAAGP